MAKLNDLLVEVRNEIGSDFIAAAIVGMDGLTIADEYADPNFDVSAAAARYAMVMKLASRVSEKLDIGEVDYNLITTDTVFFLARFLGDQSYYWGMAVTNEATLGVVRMTMSEYADQLWDAIPR